MGDGPQEKNMPMHLPISAVSYMTLARQIFSGSGSLPSVAFRQDILHPRVREGLRPAVFLPGQIERVTGSLPHFNLKEVIDSVHATTITLCPTIAYHLKDAVLMDGSVYAGEYRHLITNRSPFHVGSRKVSHLDSCALVSSYMGNMYFGHWLRDDCLQYLLAEGMAPPLCVGRPAYPHQRAYQTYFAQDWTPTDCARIRHLIIFQDFAQNSLKRKRCQVLRERLKTQFRDPPDHPYVYLRRGRTGAQRHVANESEIFNSLAAHGFHIVDVDIEDPASIIEPLMKAKVVVSMEGSHMAHCVFASPEDCCLLVLQPPDRFSMNHRAWSASLGMTFGFVVGTREAAGYCFAVSEILQTVDKMLAAA